MSFTFEELVSIEVNSVINSDNLLSCNNKYNISTDTRTLKSGDVYLPLKGESFDGEKFIEKALQNGAVGYFTTDINKKPLGNEFIIYVNDCKLAYLQLASLYRKKISPVVVGVTGSSGKTTTKELLASIFSKNVKTHKSKLNHNNEIGLCQTLLTMPVDTEVLIVEMGMRGLGEIDLLSKFASPDFAVITNIGTAHIGRLGSRENIAKAKCEIVNYFNENAKLITLDDEIFDRTLLNSNVQRSIVLQDENSFQILEAKNDYSKFVYKNEIYEINAGGEYLLQDAILAIEVALLYGLASKDIKNALMSYVPMDNRFAEISVSGYKVINDSYNANPDSMKASLKTFLELYSGKKTVVLADMKELGDDEVFYHQELGEYLNKYSDFELITVGDLAKYISEKFNYTSLHFGSNIDVVNYIKNKQSKSDYIFLKGSRSMKLEEIIEGLDK